eukprot:365126-Chlamydomonas_euryale.AAC.20
MQPLCAPPGITLPLWGRAYVIPPHGLVIANALTCHPGPGVISSLNNSHPHTTGTPLQACAQARALPVPRRRRRVRCIWSGCGVPVPQPEASHTHGQPLLGALVPWPNGGLPVCGAIRIRPCGVSTA